MNPLLRRLKTLEAAATRPERLTDEQVDAVRRVALASGAEVAPDRAAVAAWARGMVERKTAARRQAP